MKNNKQKFLYLILAIVLIIIAIVSGGIFIYDKITENSAQNDREDLSNFVNSTTPAPVIEVEDLPNDNTEPTVEPTEEPQKTWAELSLDEKIAAYKDVYGIEVPKKNIDYDALHTNTNEDIYAWITVPGTNVDDPVVQHPTDDSYYLNHNLNGTSGYPGGIYTESCNAKDFMDRMTVIYGHNMKNKTAFGSLHDYESKEFFDNNRYIFVYTPDDILVYEIFAAYESNAVHLVYGFNFTDNIWPDYLEGTLMPDTTPWQCVDSYDFKVETKVLTLSTCTRNHPNNRYLIQGALLDEVRQ